MYIFTHSRLPKIAQGPYFHTWIDAIGNKKVYTRADIEEFAKCLSKSIAKRVLHMRPGSSVKVNRLSSNNDLVLTRLHDDEIAELNVLSNLKTQIKETKQEIERLTPDLHTTLKELESRCRAAEKASDWKI